MRSREDIVKEALQAKISQSMLVMDLFSADDILVVAGFTKEGIDKLMKKYGNEVESFLKSLND